MSTVKRKNTQCQTLIEIRSITKIIEVIYKYTMCKILF